MSREAFFDDIHEPVDDPDLVANSIRPDVERACELEPGSVLLQEIRRFVDQGMID